LTTNQRLFHTRHEHTHQLGWAGTVQILINQTITVVVQAVAGFFKRLLGGTRSPLSSKANLVPVFAQSIAPFDQVFVNLAVAIIIEVVARLVLRQGGITKQDLPLHAGSHSRTALGLTGVLAFVGVPIAIVVQAITDLFGAGLAGACVKLPFVTPERGLTVHRAAVLLDLAIHHSQEGIDVGVGVALKDFGTLPLGDDVPNASLDWRHFWGAGLSAGITDIYDDFDSIERHVVSMEGFGAKPELGTPAFLLVVVFGACVWAGVSHVHVKDKNIPGCIRKDKYRLSGVFYAYTLVTTCCNQQNQNQPALSHVITFSSCPVALWCFLG
jgi:hypothetical protein